MLLTSVILLWHRFIYEGISGCNVNKSENRLFTRPRWSSTTFSSNLAGGEDQIDLIHLRVLLIILATLLIFLSMQIKLQLICSPPQPASLQKTGSSMHNLRKAVRKTACHSWHAGSQLCKASVGRNFSPYYAKWFHSLYSTYYSLYSTYYSLYSTYYSLYSTYYWTLSEKSLTESIEELNTKRPTLVFTKKNHEPWLVILRRIYIQK